MKVNKKIIISIAVLLALLTMAYLGINRDFDAQGYTKAILDQHFRGEVEAALEFIDDVSEEELYQQYEDGMNSFVENNLISGVEMDDDMKAKYAAYCKDIFLSIQYEVGEAEKISRDEYRVPVTYKASDVFEKYIALISDVTTPLQEKVDKGEYKGSVEEINAQIQADFLEGSYEALKAAYDTMEYAEDETMIFTIKKDESDLFTMNETEISEFVVKIMKLDEIQD